MKFIDFFAGIGGLRLGLEQAGHKCAGFCEFDKFARQSYKAMYNTEGEWECHDIRTASSVELPEAERRAAAYLTAILIWQGTRLAAGRLPQRKDDEE